MKSEISNYLALIGSKGGKSKSAKKLAAIAKNAKKGGRPRRTKAGGREDTE